LGGGSTGNWDNSQDNLLGTLSISPANPATNTWVEATTTFNLPAKYADETNDYIWLRVQYVAQGANAGTAAAYDGRCALDWVRFKKR
jgi:hypothetical protein